MNALNLLEAPAALAVVAFVIVRQVCGEPLHGRRLVVLPMVLAVVGLARLDKSGHHLTTADIACLVIGAAIAAGIGAAQGAQLRLEPRDGVLWARTPVRGLWLWLALVASRLAMTLVAMAFDAHVAASTTPILMLLGVNRLGQAAVITQRALVSGVPFAPEKDGRPFDVRATPARLLVGTAHPSSPGIPQPASHPAAPSPRPAPYPQAVRRPTRPTRPAPSARTMASHDRAQPDVPSDQDGRRAR
ncbi:hypothetical protein [Streptomyces sp. Ag109_O5-10]|uniref:hypothetical protein n=1 Tax=Streptomyces sp. Ag109_O5-10 TaxID=1855349 RepID=UPI00089A4164|nr:hypothetical protein [Streptomyces sp. Ag109_O5-10]SEE87267.1 hypothetical protein SAMN05216533_4093 [Streptomyces sp. Ag109_O5-10]